MTLKRILLALFTVALLLPLGVGSAPPAQATHTCSVVLYEHINYTGEQISFPCPGAYSGGHYSWPWFPGMGWNDRASSIRVHIPTCDIGVRLWWNAPPGDSPSLGGEGLYGPGTWEISDLRPYGWNDAVSSLTILSNIYNC